MSENTPDTANYTMGYSDEFRQLLNRRSAETHAFHLLPHLRPSMRVLDFGCGPGTITVGLEADTGLRPAFALEAFRDLEQDVRQSIARIQANPFIPVKDQVRGFIYDCSTGCLNEVSPS